MHYFAAVARAGSVSAAAETLHVASSAVSRQVTKLESAIGVELFARQRHGMRLTEAGERLAAHLASVAAEGERVLGQVKGLHEISSQTVRLACTEGFSTCFLPLVVRRFRSDHAMALIHIHVVTPADATRMLRQGQVDLALKYSTAPERHCRALFSDLAPLHALTEVAHPLARRRSVTLAEVVKYPMLISTVDATVRLLFDLACSQRGLHYEAAVVSNHSSAMLPLVQGRDAALVGREVASYWTRDGTLAATPFVAGELPLRRVNLLATEGVALSPLAQALANGVIEALGYAKKRRSQRAAG
ncbi:MAG: LysR family transcriptional regulator [Burkholderiales bacterium]